MCSRQEEKGDQWHEDSFRNRGCRDYVSRVSFCDVCEAGVEMRRIQGGDNEEDFGEMPPWPDSRNISVRPEGRPPAYLVRTPVPGQRGHPSTVVLRVSSQ